MERGITGVIKRIVMSALSATLMLGFVIGAAGTARSDGAGGATFTVNNDTRTAFRFLGFTPPDAVAGTIQAGWECTADSRCQSFVPPGTYVIRTSTGAEVTAEITIDNNPASIGMRRNSAGVQQVRCMTAVGKCSPGAEWTNTTTARFVIEWQGDSPSDGGPPAA